MHTSTGKLTQHARRQQRTTNDRGGANTTADVAHSTRLRTARSPFSPNGRALRELPAPPPGAQEGQRPPSCSTVRLCGKLATSSRAAPARNNRNRPTRAPAQYNKKERQRTSRPRTMILGKRPDELVLAIEHARVWSITCLRCRHDGRAAATATKKGGAGSDGCSRKGAAAKPLAGGAPRFKPAGGGPPAGRAGPGRRAEAATVSKGGRTRRSGRAGEPSWRRQQTHPRGHQRATAAATATAAAATRVYLTRLGGSGKRAAGPPPTL